MRYEYRIDVANSPWNMCVDFRLAVKEYGEGPVKRTSAIAHEGQIEMREWADAASREPTASISQQNAQEIFDTLYAAGFRPNGGRDAAGVHEAQREHIDDLRKVVGHFLSKQGA